MNQQAMVKQEQERLVPQEATVDDIIAQVSKIQTLMKKAMQNGEHYGTVPGCGDKPTLLQPGAEKLGLLFRLAPKYKVEKTNHPGGHREYEIVCELYHINTGAFFGSGVGNCSTMESKYRYRNAARKCPDCEKETIIKGKEQYGGGWLCWKKKGGCGATWKDGAEEIEKQEAGKVEHDNPADYYNTVEKMAKKRAFVDAIKSSTAASDIFTQDVEELAQNNVITVEPVQPEPQPSNEPPYVPPKESNPKGITPADRKRLFGIAEKFGRDETTVKRTLLLYNLHGTDDIKPGDHYESICWAVEFVARCEAQEITHVQMMEIAGKYGYEDLKDVENPDWPKIIADVKEEEGVPELA